MWTEGSSKNFEQPTPGTKIARCVKVIDIGTQESEWEGIASYKRQNIIAWELPNDLLKDGEYAGQPFLVSKFYTASLGEKANLRKDLVNWRGRDFTKEELKGFDPKNVLGKSCMLSVTLNEKGKAKVTGVIALPKGMEVPSQFNPSVYFMLDEKNFDQAGFDVLSDGYKKMIMNSSEWVRMQKKDHAGFEGFKDDSEQVLHGGIDDDLIPF